MTIICVDLSKYQKGFDFAKFKSSGGLGVILKATEGTSVKDSSYTTFRPQAEAAGLAVATYHFFRSSDPVAQANYYLDFASPEPGERVVCDFEDDNASVANMVKFFQEIQARDPSLQLTVYSGHTIKDKLTSRDDWLAENTSLWIAQYTTASKPSWPTSTWKQWSLWQYTDQTPAPGFSGPVDQNRFNGPDTQFVKWMGPAQDTPAPEPAPPIADSVSVSVTLASDHPVTITIIAGENVSLA